MPTYEYKGPDGDVVERYFDMGQAPDAITVDLVPYERCIGTGSRPIVRSLDRRSADRPVIGWSLPWKGDDEMTPEMEAAVPKWTRQGVPVFGNAGEAERFCDASKRAADKDDSVRSFDFGSAGPDAVEYTTDAVREERRKKAEGTQWRTD